MSTQHQGTPNINPGTNPDPANEVKVIKTVFGDQELAPAVNSPKRSNPPGASGYTPEEKRANIAKPADTEMQEHDDSGSQISVSTGNESMEFMEANDTINTVVNDDGRLTGYNRPTAGQRLGSLVAAQPMTCRA